jgi:hypothetical protein
MDYRFPTGWHAPHARMKRIQLFHLQVGQQLDQCSLGRGVDAQYPADA